MMRRRFPIVFDLFGVLIRKQSSSDQGRLAALSGMSAAGFRAAYWQERPAYDCGCSADIYWTAVGARQGMSFDSERVDQLTVADNRSWADVNPNMLAFLRELRGYGMPLYLLSNIPQPLLAFLDARHGWLSELFEQRFMSCEMGVAKPAVQAFDNAFSSIARRHPGHPIRFIDDSPNNVMAARALSIRSHRYEHPAALRTWLSGPARA